MGSRGLGSTSRSSRARVCRSRLREAAVIPTATPWSSRGARILCNRRGMCTALGLWRPNQRPPAIGPPFGGCRIEAHLARSVSSGSTGRLDLADLDRVAEDFHVVLLGSVRSPMRDGTRPNRDEACRNRLRITRERVCRPPTAHLGVGGGQGSRTGSRGSHRGHRAAEPSPAAYLEVAGLRPSLGGSPLARGASLFRPPRTRSRS